MYDVFIDVGNQLIKIGYQNSKQEWIIHKLPTHNSNADDFENLFNQLKINHIYMGSVVGDTTKSMKAYFDKKRIPYTIINNDQFIDSVNFEGPINLNEVGTDILGFAYLIKEYKNALAINFGTATVAIHYDQSIKGVCIGIDFFNSYYEFLKRIKIDVGLGTYSDFGMNTKDAIDSSRYFLINGFINEILKKYPTIKTIIYTGGNRRIFNSYINEKHLQIIEIDEAVIKGYKRLIYKD